MSNSVFSAYLRRLMRQSGFDTEDGVQHAKTELEELKKENLAALRATELKKVVHKVAFLKLMIALADPEVQMEVDRQATGMRQIFTEKDVIELVRELRPDASVVHIE